MHSDGGWIIENVALVLQLQTAALQVAQMAAFSSDWSRASCKVQMHQQPCECRGTLGEFGPIVNAFCWEAE